MKSIHPKIIARRFVVASSLLTVFGAAGPALAHEGHGDTVHHAFMHLLQEPDHLLLLVATAVVIFAAWRYFKGKNK